MKKSYGWLVLTAFSLLAGVNQMLWLNFAPIISVVQKKYDISELTANVSLLMTFPILYVVLGIPSGLWIDKKGYRFVLSVSAVVMSLGSLLRINDSSFLMLVAGQSLIALSQPFILNGISKIVADWFEKEHHALATGLGTIGMFIGMAFAMAVTPALIHDTEIHGAMIIFAGITIAVSLFFVLVARESGRETPAMAGTWGEIKVLIKNRNLAVIFIMAFLALGFFNSFTTWLELILAQRGITTEEAGIIGGGIIIGGIIGSAIIPAVSDWIGRRKVFLTGCALMASLLIYPLATGGNYGNSLVLAVFFGALVLPAFALLLTMSEEEAGQDMAGAATGFLMLAGNTGTVLITVLMDVVKSDPGDWTNSIYLLLGVIIMAAVLSHYVQDTYDKKNIHYNIKKF